MNYQIEPNGDVTFLLEKEDIDQIIAFKDQSLNNVDTEVLASILDYYGYLGNGLFMPINPEDVGALTDAPMFTSEADYNEDGSKHVTGNVWWFPNYAVESFTDTLIESGQVTFTLARH